jgi:hypothetical protein
VSVKLTLLEALAALGASATSARLLEMPAFDVSVYKPEAHDLQGPHKRDELYVIASGSGDFACEGKQIGSRPVTCFSCLLGPRITSRIFQTIFQLGWSSLALGPAQERECKQVYLHIRRRHRGLSPQQTKRFRDAAKTGPDGLDDGLGCPSASDAKLHTGG